MSAQNVVSVLCSNLQRLLGANLDNRSGCSSFLQYHGSPETGSATPIMDLARTIASAGAPQTDRIRDALHACPERTPLLCITVADKLSVCGDYDQAINALELAPLSARTDAWRRTRSKILWRAGKFGDACDSLRTATGNGAGADSTVDEILMAARTLHLALLDGTRLPEAAEWLLSRFLTVLGACPDGLGPGPIGGARIEGIYALTEIASMLGSRTHLDSLRIPLASLADPPETADPRFLPHLALAQFTLGNYNRVTGCLSSALPSASRGDYRCLAERLVRALTGTWRFDEALELLRQKQVTVLHVARFTVYRLFINLLQHNEISEQDIDNCIASHTLDREDKGFLAILCREAGLIERSLAFNTGLRDHPWFTLNLAVTLEMADRHSDAEAVLRSLPGPLPRGKTGEWLSEPAAVRLCNLALNGHNTRIVPDYDFFMNLLIVRLVCPKARPRALLQERYAKNIAAWQAMPDGSSLRHYPAFPDHKGDRRP